MSKITLLHHLQMGQLRHREVSAACPKSHSCGLSPPAPASAGVQSAVSACLPHYKGETPADFQHG